MSQVHLRPDAARRGPTRLRPQDVASPTRRVPLELLRSHVRPCRFATCFSAARAKADAARRAGPPRPTADPPPPPSHVRHWPTRTPRPTCGADTSDRAAASAAVARPTWADATATSDVSARHLRQRGRPRRRRTSDMGRRGRHVPRVGPDTSDSEPCPTPSHVRHGPTRPPRATCRPFFFDKSERESAATAAAGPTSPDKL